MVPVHTVLFLSLSLTITGVMISDYLITFSYQHGNDCIALVSVQSLFYFLFPFTFTSAIILLLLHVAIRQSPSIKHLTMATQVLVSSILLFSIPVMVYTAFTEAAVLDTLKFMIISVAAPAMNMYDPFNRYINHSHQTARNSVPAFLGLCISASTFLFIGTFFSLSDKNDESTLGPIPFGLLFLSLNYLNLFLADEPRVAIPAVLIEYLVQMVLVMSFNIVLIDICVIVELLVGIF
jgi:hypothetical protein